MYDPVDERGVPASRGIPKLVQVATIIGILTIFGIGGATVMMAGSGHYWPATKTATIPLSAPH